MQTLWTTCVLYDMDHIDNRLEELKVSIPESRHESEITMPFSFITWPISEQTVVLGRVSELAVHFDQMIGGGGET